MKKKRVGVWIRVSTDMQGDSPEHHRQRAMEYAQFKDWEVVEEYNLVAVSGKSVIKHPEAQRMIADIKRGHISGIIFSKIARLARNLKELLEFSEIFEEYKADLVSIEQAIDTSTPVGKLTFTIIGALAEWEYGEISARVLASIPIRAKLGKPLGGQAPYGYAWDEKTLVVDDVEAAIRLLMYDLFIEHKRKRTVARLLNEKGYRTRKGAKFSDTTIARLLEDPIVIGMRRTNYTTLKSGKKEIKDSEDWIYTESTAIIPQETWDDVQAILTEQKKTNKKPLKTSLHLFTGYAMCSCGQKMYILSSINKYVCKSCKQKIPADDLEAIFKEQLQNFSISPDSAQEILEAGNNQYIEKERLLKTTEKHIEEIKKKIQSLFTLHEQGQLETTDFNEHYAEPKARLEELTTEHEELLTYLNSYNQQTTIISRTLDVLQDVYGRWDELTKQQKRNIIESMTERIIIDTDSVEITIKQLNPFF